LCLTDYGSKKIYILLNNVLKVQDISAGCRANPLVLYVTWIYWHEWPIDRHPTHQYDSLQIAAQFHPWTAGKGRP